MTKIASLIKGKLPYDHIYMQTMTGFEVAHHELDVPKQLKTLAKNPNAEICTFGDGSLGIEIEGNVWAIESSITNPNYPTAKRLPKEVWHYIRLASDEIAKAA